MSIKQHFNYYLENIQQEYFQEKHGQNVLEVLLIHSLDELGQIDKEHLKQLLTHCLKLQIQSQTQFLQFISYLYFHYNRNTCNKVMEELVDPKYIEDFLNQNVQQNNFSNNIQRSKVENLIMSDFIQTFHYNNNNQQQNNYNEEETKTMESGFLNKGSNDSQQISYNQNNSFIPYIQSLNNSQNNEQQLYQQFRTQQFQQNSQPNINIPKNKNEEETKTMSSGFFDKLSNDPQQISYYQNNPNNIPYIQRVNNSQNEQQLYYEFRTQQNQQNTQPNMNIPYQQYSLQQQPQQFINQLNNQQYDNKEFLKEQNPKLQIGLQNMKDDKQQNQQNNRILSDEDPQMKIQFQQLVNQCENVTDAISEIKQLETKYKFLSIQHDFEYIDDQFIYYYQSQQQGIPRIDSVLQRKKKEAQHDAARKFLPHLRQFIKLYFEKNKENKEQLFQRANSANDSNQIEKTQFNEDQELLLNFQNDVKALYLIIESHEGAQAHDVLRIDESQKEGDIFKCKVKFWKNGEALFTTSGLGGSKKDAKNVAFMKMNRLVQQYYKTSKSVESLKNINNIRPVQ